MSAVVEAAPAKVNLTLHVLGRREDGYHELESLVVFAGTGDRLTVEPSDKLTFTVTGPNAAALADTPDTDNLVLKAAHALDDGQGRGAAITLEKNLPVAAGIGGGSADAAAALRALNRFWNCELPPQELAAKGLSLGADVPVCVHAPQPAIMAGIGERISRSPQLPKAWMVLVNPGVPVSTPAVFKALAAGPVRGNADTFWPGSFRDAQALARFLLTCRNDLEPPARKLVPEVGETLNAIGTTKGCLLARMSGSGATCFGLYADEAAARAAADALNRPGWWVAAAEMLAG